MKIMVSTIIKYPEFLSQTGKKFKMLNENLYISYLKYFLDEKDSYKKIQYTSTGIYYSYFKELLSSMILNSNFKTSKSSLYENDLLFKENCLYDIYDSVEDLLYKYLKNSKENKLQVNEITFDKIFEENIISYINQRLIEKVFSNEKKNIVNFLIINKKRKKTIIDVFEGNKDI